MSWRQRTELLVGGDGLEALKGSTVAVIGLGGVGAYAGEMVARAGVGRIIILDSDQVSQTNKNRQLLAMDSTLGMSKVRLMEARLRDINSELEVISIQEYLTQENVSEILHDGLGIDYLIDAIDTLAPKISLIAHCVKNKIPFVSSMGAGAKYDATKIRVVDISKSYNCPLAYILRKKLRKLGISKGFKVVFSEELPDKDSVVAVEDQINKKSQAGTISYLPAVFGCVCAQAAIAKLLDRV